jgi:hypothetical protein
MFIARDQWGAQNPTSFGPFMRSIRSRDNAVTRLWARRSWVLFSSGLRIPSLFQSVQNGFGGHPNSYSVGTWDSFVGGIAAGACTWPPISILFRMKNTWTCTSVPPICPYVAHRNNFTFYLFVGWIYGWLKMTTSTKLLRMWEVHVLNPGQGTGYNKKSYFAVSVSTVFQLRGSDVTTVFLLIFAYSSFTNRSVF